MNRRWLLLGRDGVDVGACAGCDGVNAGVSVASGIGGSDEYEGGEYAEREYDGGDGMTVWVCYLVFLFSNQRHIPGLLSPHSKSRSFWSCVNDILLAPRYIRTGIQCIYSARNNLCDAILMARLIRFHPQTHDSLVSVEHMTVQKGYRQIHRHYPK